MEAHIGSGDEMRALITGITGQDGSYLAELLLYKRYEVYWLVQLSALVRNANVSEHGSAVLCFGSAAPDPKKKYIGVPHSGAQLCNTRRLAKGD